MESGREGGLIVGSGMGRVCVIEFRRGRVAQYLRRHVFGESVEGVGSKVVLLMIGSSGLRNQFTLSLIGLCLGIKCETV